jgi:hypothetical protein
MSWQYLYCYPYLEKAKSQLVFVGEEISPAGWRSAPALSPKKRRGLSVLLVTRLVDQHTGARKVLEWFGPPERNTLLHCAMYCSRARMNFVSVCLRLGPFCNTACLPFYSRRGACTEVLSPDMWAQGHNEYSTWSHKCVLLGHSSWAPTFEIYVSLACRGSSL